MAKKRQEKQHIVKSKGAHFSKLGESFKATRFDKRYWEVFFLGLLYTSITALIFLAVLYFAVPSVQSSIYGLGALEYLGEYGDTSQIIPFLVPVLSTILGFFLLFLVFHFLIGSIFKGWVWRKIFRKKMSFLFYLRYLGFRLISGILVSLAVIIMLLLSNSSPLLALFLLIALLLIHLFAVSLIYFIRDNIIWRSIKQGFKKGIRIHLFLLPYLFFLGLLLVRMLINNVLQAILVKTEFTFNNLLVIIQNLVPYLQSIIPYLIVSTIVGLFFVTYMRIFYAEFVSRL